jgi:hypothetical protein
MGVGVRMGAGVGMGEGIVVRRIIRLTPSRTCRGHSLSHETVRLTNMTDNRKNTKKTKKSEFMKFARRQSRAE